MNTAVIGLGSNIDPEKNIQEGKQVMSSQFTVLKISHFLRTPPKGNLQQSEFVNGCVLIETNLSQLKVKEVLKGLELQIGRTNAMRLNHPRIIDFDIHVWNDEIVDPHFYDWDFLRTIILEVLPDLKYDYSKVV